MQFVICLNTVISIIFTVCYLYQYGYVLIGLFRKKKNFIATKENKFALIVSARNEEAVIGNLIKSLKEQDYPEELFDVFVVADNCTDDTAEVSRKAGAIVHERFDNLHVGKGYALNWIFHIIMDQYKEKNYDGYMIFDADNIVSSNFVTEMNKVFSNGYKVVTSYRNSKNYGENWISAGYSLWFLREAKFLNNARMAIGSSCAISGTGFLVSSEIIRKNNGWIHYLLTEDIEFTTDYICHGEKIGYCEDAVLYDEQPTKFYQSYLQRLRWSKGFYQVFAKYSKPLCEGVARGNFSCYDMLMTLAPAMLLTLLSTFVNFFAFVIGAINYSVYLPNLIEALVKTIGGFYMIFLFLGGLTTITEWKQIHTTSAKKIFYVFTFPLFMFTYVPISIIALFKKVEWKHIEHTVSTNVEEICNR